MYSMQTGCYYFTKEEARMILSWIKEKLDLLKLFKLNPCKSV